jgi:uncharacterized protein YutE (UPF0331/DUF86 family)
LEELKPTDLEIFKISLKDRRALEHQLQIMIECIVDIAFLLVKFLHLGPARNETSIFDLLKEYLSNIEKLSEMRKLRNILVHQYGVVNDELLYQFVNEETDDFLIFIEDVRKVITENDGTIL